MNLKFIKLFLAACLIHKTLAAASCNLGYYGEKCNNACSDGCPIAVTDNSDLTKCDKDTGACEFVSGDACKEGYTSSDDQKRCDQAVCFGNKGCAEGGECVAPNYCICGKSGAQVVALNKEFEGDNGQMIQGTNCVSLRKDGIKGAFIALAVMVISISICGTIERVKNGPARKRYVE